MVARKAQVVVSAMNLVHVKPPHCLDETSGAVVSPAPCVPTMLEEQVHHWRVRLSQSHVQGSAPGQIGETGSIPLEVLLRS